MSGSVEPSSMRMSPPGSNGNGSANGNVPWWLRYLERFGFAAVVAGVLLWGQVKAQNDMVAELRALRVEVQALNIKLEKANTILERRP